MSGALKLYLLDERFAGALNFRCVGPLPPYSFCTAEVEKIDPQMLDAARSVLELPSAPSFQEVKQAHRRLVQQFHPDRDRTETAANRLKEVGAAFKLLERYYNNVKQPLSSDECQGLTMVKIRKLSELRAEVSAPSMGEGNCPL